MNNRPVGWYPDPWDDQKIRYWDCGRWTDFTRPRYPKHQFAWRAPVVISAALLVAVVGVVIALSVFAAFMSNFGSNK